MPAPMDENGRNVLGSTLRGCLLYFFLWDWLSRVFFREVRTVVPYLSAHLVRSLHFLFSAPWYICYKSLKKKQETKKKIECILCYGVTIMPLLEYFCNFYSGRVFLATSHVDQTAHDWDGAFDFYNCCSQQEQSKGIQILPEMYN